MPVTLTSNEKRYGTLLIAAYLLVLPILISYIGEMFVLDAAQQNLIHYVVGFSAAVWIFRRFLRGNLLVALDAPFPVLWYAVLGYLGSQTIGELVSMLTFLISPDFVNINDSSLALQLRNSPLLALAVVILVPVTEELLFRGLVFRGLYGRSRAAAYIVSIALFSAIHVLGYVGSTSVAHLLLGFVQYLPAAYCLCFAYRRSGTIVSPILLHIANNAIAIITLMR